MSELSYFKDIPKSSEVPLLQRAQRLETAAHLIEDAFKQYLYQDNSLLYIPNPIFTMNGATSWASPEFSILFEELKTLGYSAKFISKGVYLIPSWEASDE